MIAPFDPVIGIIGGGQLGKMLIEASAPWNIRFAVLDPDPNAPARRYAENFINTSLTSDSGIHALSDMCSVITYEIEHVNQFELMLLEQQGKRVVPSASVLGMIQDKGLQKSFYKQHKLPTTDFRLVNNAQDWIEAAQALPGDILVAKSRKGGYDGRGVELLERKKLLSGYIPFNDAALLEVFVDKAIELSIIVAQKRNGETAVYPAVQMHFDPRSNLVDYLYSPASVSHHIQEQASNIALNAVKAMDSEGLFAVELFVDAQGEVFINEIAPRPHNSGHHTIEAFYTSQYEMLLRVLLDLPLGSTRQLKPAVMVNVVGPGNVNGAYRIAGLNEVLQEEGVYVHLYNKQETRPDRKIGHFTCMADDLNEAINKAQRVRNHFKIEAAI